MKDKQNSFVYGFLRLFFILVFSTKFFSLINKGKIMDQLTTKLNNSFESKKVVDLEIVKKCKANNFLLIDTQYGKNITVTLDDKFRIVLPDRYTKLTGKSYLKFMNEKPIYFTYNGLEDIIN